MARQEKRPKSASLLTELFSEETESKKRPKSTEGSRRPAFPENTRLKKQRPLFEARKFCCCCCCRCRKPRREGANFRCLDSKCFNGYHGIASDEEGNESWTGFNHSLPPRNCRSDLHFSTTNYKNVSDTEREFRKIIKSLGFLGIELSDFGILSDCEKILPKKKTQEKPTSFTSKLNNRSISLDSSRASGKQAWADESLEESRRSLLAQAAYEEWFSRKEEQLRVKRNEEKLTRLKTEEKLRDDFKRKKEKSEEEFRKWLHRKRMKSTGSKRNLTQNQKNLFNTVIKTKEECEKAFIKWKKTKEQALKKDAEEKKKEQERRLESEKIKNEKKLVAEKAFQQWKTKLRETKMLGEVKRRREKENQELQEKRKREKLFQVPFEAWKATKEKQIKEKIKKNRETNRLAREERLAQIEERMWEAKQAFEDWLEKLDSRKQKQLLGINGYNRVIPWIPA